MKQFAQGTRAFLSQWKSFSNNDDSGHIEHLLSTDHVPDTALTTLCILINTVLVANHYFLPNGIHEKLRHRGVK